MGNVVPQREPAKTPARGGRRLGIIPPVDEVEAQSPATRTKVPPTSPSPAILVPRSVLALQRQAGNRAVSEIIVSRDPETSTLESGYAEGVAAGNWEAAARALAAMDDAGRRGRITAATTAVILDISRASEAADLPEVRNQLATELLLPARAGEAQRILRERELAAAMAGPDWPRVARALDGFPPAEIFTRVEALTLDQLNALTAAARPLGDPVARMLGPAETARIAKLLQEWTAAFTAGTWARAVTLVQAYNDTDLPLQLDRLGYDQIEGLCAQADRMLPAYERTRRAAEPIRIRKLGEAYGAAVTGADWARATQLVNAYNDDDLLTRSRQIAAAGAPALTTARAAAAAHGWDDNHRVRRTLSFLAVEPLTGSAVRPATSSGVTGGTATPAVPVPETGGTSTFSSGATIGSTTGVYGLSYDGPAAPQTGWIQFIARNIETFDASGTSLSFTSGSWTPSGQGARAFSTSTAPRWYLDTLSNQSPFYEAVSAPPGTGQGASDLSPTRTAMYDRPSGRADLVNPLFTGAVKSVRSRALFDTYLVSGMRVLSHDTITVEYVFTAAGPEPAGTTTHTGGGRVSALPADRFRAITARFPDFAYLPH